MESSSSSSDTLSHQLRQRSSWRGVALLLVIATAFHECSVVSGYVMKTPLQSSRSNSNLKQCWNLDNKHGERHLIKPLHNAQEVNPSTMMKMTHHDEVQNEKNVPKGMMQRDRPGTPSLLDSFSQLSKVVLTAAVLWTTPSILPPSQNQLTIATSTDATTTTTTKTPFYHQHLTLHAPSALAADYGSLSPEQKLVAEAWRLVDNSYLDRTFNHQDWFQLRQDAVKRRYKSMDEAQDAVATLVSSLGDKYTRYLPPSQYQSLVDAATGTLAGVGVEISTNAEENTVIASDVEENSPASRAGILPGDVFVEVDGYKVPPSATPDDVAAKLRGPEGSKVGVVMRRGESKTLDVIVTREKITVTSVKSYLSSNTVKLPSAKGKPVKVGVVKIKSFSGTTAQKVTSALKELEEKGAGAFVLDLRNNPGGLLPGGVDTASLFLDADQPVVFVVNKNGIVDSQSTFTSGLDMDSPLVVLVNKNTASAAEVLTAALQENKRATIVGEQPFTFGKGIVQTVKGLSNGADGGVAVTVARYETPLHNSIHLKGIKVDVNVDDCGEDAGACVPSDAFKEPVAL